MPRKYKYPFLYDSEWWKNNQHRTDVEIGRKHNCPISTVRAARHRMGVPPLSGSWLAKNQWTSIQFRRKRSEWPQLYSEEFWIKNELKTNSEIAKELECTFHIVLTARRFMGVHCPSRSEAQIRRYARQGLPKRRVEIDRETRGRVLRRANNKCEIPICENSGNDVLEIDHIIDMTNFNNAEEANKEKNLISLCKWHHKWWAQFKKTRECETVFSSKNPYKETISIFKKFFPKL